MLTHFKLKKNLFWIGLLLFFYGASFAKAGLNLEMSKKDSKAYDNWMGQLEESIRYKPIKSLIIPGTHDSGTYGIQKPLELSPDMDPIFKAWLEQNPQKNEHLLSLKGWTVTQTLNIYQALQSGVRYFDLRLCMQGDIIRTCHGLYAASLEEILKSVAKFIKNPKHAKELIILDINHLYYLEKEDRAKLINLLKQQFGDKIASRSQFTANSLLIDFWQNKKQIIVLMEDDETSIDRNLYWPSDRIESPWPNADETIPLIDDMLSALIHRNHDKLFVLQTQETPKIETIADSVINLRPTSLFKMTSEYKPEVLKWLNQSQQKSLIRSQGNILIEDFSNGIDLTELAKELNQ